MAITSSLATGTSESAGRDDRESFRGPAPLANKFRVHNTGNNIRLSFLEESTDGRVVEFRAAVALSHEDFHHLVSIVNLTADSLNK